MKRITSFFGSSIGFNLLFVLEGLTALLIDTTVASLLGLGIQSDILYAAWNLPNIIGRGVFQSLTASFLGLFEQAQDKDTLQTESFDTRVLYNEAISLVTISATILTLALFLTLGWWLPLLTNGLSEEAQRQSIAIGSILVWSLCFLAPIETIRAILYRRGRTIFPSIGRLFAAFVTVTVMIALQSRFALSLFAWAILIGSALEFCLGIAMLHRDGTPYQFRFPSRRITFIVLRTAGMPLCGQSIRAVASLVELAIASLFGPGYLTAVSYVRRLINMLERFVFQGVVFATIKSYTTHSEADRWKQMHRLVIFLAIPIFVALAICSTPIIRILFGRREFTESDVLLLSSILSAHSIAIISIASSRVPLGLTYGRKQGEIILGYFMIVSIILLLTEYLLFSLAWVPMHLIFGIAYAVSIGCASLWLSYHLPEKIQLWRDQQLLKLLLMGSTAYGVSILFHQYLWANTAQAFSVGASWLELATTTATGILAAIAIGFLVRQTEVLKVKGYLT